MMTPSTAARRGGRIRRHATHTAVALLAFGVALVVAEGVVRLAAPQQLILIRPDLWQPADTVGYLHRPNASVRINTGERTVTVHTDRDGFRVGQSGRREAPTQVLLLGDSFMEALQVEHEATAAHLLEERLEEHLGRAVAVRNAGVVGWDPNHYLIRARALLPRDSFALVIVALFVGNDAVHQRTDYHRPRAPVERNRFRLPRRLAWPDLVGGLLAPANDALEVRSHLYILVKNQLSILRMRLGLAAAPFPSEYRVAEADSPRWRLTAEIATDLAALAEARGTPTLFALIPYHFQVDEEEFYDYLRGYGIDSSTVDIDQPSRLLHHELTARGHEVVDVLPVFRRAKAAGAALFGSVDTHFSAAGHELFTEVIVPDAVRLLTGGNPGAGRPRR